MEKCLAHPWIKARSAPMQSTQIVEGLNSSTSSLDSALCLDSASSLEPSPCSSASSSFAPRPSTKPADDRDETDNLRTSVDIRQVTEKVSKLCTEMQKAEIQSSGLKPASVDEQALPNGNLDGNLDGSVSSISSTESNRTVKIEDEEPHSMTVQDKGTESDSSASCVSPVVCVPVEGKRSPIENQRNRYVSTGSTTDEEPCRISRPNSALRAITPISADLISLAPETVEKLKKFERLKQKKEENKYATLPSPRKNRNASERPVSPSQPVQPSCTETSSLNSVTMANIVRRPLAPSKSLSPQPTPVDLGPKNLPSGSALSKTRSVSPPSIVSSSRKPALPPVKEKTVEETRSESPRTQIGKSDDRLPLPATAEKLSNNLKRPTRAAVPDAVVETAPAAPTTSSNSPTTSKTTAKASPLRILPPAEPSMVKYDSESDVETRSLKPVKTAGSSSVTTPTSQATEREPVLDKPFSTPAQNLSVTASEGLHKVVVQRRQKPLASQTRLSWRQTPHIDPDVIDALLRGDFTEADLKTLDKRNSRLEPFIEEEDSPPMENSTAGVVQSYSLPSSISTPTHATDKARILSGLHRTSRSSSSVKVTPPPTVKEDEISCTVMPSPSSALAMSGHLDSEVILRSKSMSTANRRQVIVVSTPVFDENLSYGSPLQSPSSLSERNSSSREGSPAKHARLGSLQSSMTLSHSTPDLSAIIGASKSAKRNKQKEDSYVMDTGTPRTSSISRRTPLHNRSSVSSIRTTLLSGGNIVRSLSISGRHAKRTSSKRPGYKI